MFFHLPISKAWRQPGLAHHILDDPSLQRSYFRNVAEGEAPELVTAESCSQSLPSCDASYVPRWDIEGLGFCQLRTSLAIAGVAKKDATNSCLDHNTGGVWR